MLSPKVFLLSCLLLATSLYVAIDQSALIEKGLSGQVVPEPWAGSLDGNRPISTCRTDGFGQSSSNIQTGSTVGNVAQEDHDTRPCPINFSLSLSPANLKQVQGSSTLVHVLVTLVSGTPAQVTMSARGMPAATEILFAPISGRPSFLSAMTIATHAETPVGQFNITIVARGGGLEKSAILSLEVLPFMQVVPPVHDIAIVSASVQKTTTVGGIVFINVTASNHGSVPETFQLQAYANTTLVADQFVLKLAPAAIDQPGSRASDLPFWNSRAGNHVC